MRLILLLFLLVDYLSLFAQTSINTPWTWLKGDTTGATAAVYGTQTQSSPANKPKRGQFSVGWKDATGNFWLFGGENINHTGYSNELWKYDPVINEWTWMKGSSVTNTLGIYGTRGVADPADSPGSRAYSVAWTDNNGYLWLFGGIGYSSIGSSGAMNDVWRYDPSTNQWTWIDGADTSRPYPIYGTQGIQSDTTTPGGRMGSAGCRDASGNLYLFGGQGNITSNQGEFLNGIWKYNISSRQWTWLRGESSGGQPGIYGIQGSFSPTNNPGSRNMTTVWMDNSGLLWLFGGYGSDFQFASRELEDLWKYDPAINQWMWVKGSNQGDQPAIRGSLGVADINNSPGGRYGAGNWKDSDGNLFLFGGGGLLKNDLWKYKISDNTWVWLKGDAAASQEGIYGTVGVANVYSKPGSRLSPVTWIDNSGYLWLYGAYGYPAIPASTYLNDIWKINGNVLKALVPVSSVNNGNWNDPNTWSNSLVPDDYTQVVINHNIIVIANGEAYSVSVANGGSLVVNSGVSLNIVNP